MAADKFSVVGSNIAEKATVIWNVADIYEYVIGKKEVPRNAAEN